ncbi:helix-turn-helix domain-containing protein [Holdemanella biformis]|uniref:helix-turn-helix domain-containing protein n=1 Tax=Holdemanella biformis TaxID=1735 RepID=UPI002585C740|nr:helix-turn-helix transcriptional regulator [Holdemanella biformis]MEE0473269.1 helix-turn-helix transcriptional regulator [Holdemanella biformis]
MFKERLKELRKSKGLSQKQLAEKTGISVHTINSYESGRRDPNTKNLQILQDFFQVSQGFLLGELKSDDFFKDQEVIDLNLDTVLTQISMLKQNMKISESYQNRVATLFLLKSLNYINNEMLCRTTNTLDENDINSLFNALILLNDKGLKEAIKRIQELTYITTYTNK